MSLRIDYHEWAISQAAAFLDDPYGIRAVLDAIDRLADVPRPARSFPYGSLDCCGGWHSHCPYMGSPGLQDTQRR